MAARSRGRQMNEYLNNKNFERIINEFQNSKKDQTKIGILIQDIRETIHRKKIRKADVSFNRSQLREKERELETAQDLHEESKQKLAIAFFTLSENIVRYAKFKLIDQDDAVQEGVMICFDKIERFDSRKGKAFNYMTTCILNHFRQLYRTSRNYNELKIKYLNHIQSMAGGSYFKNGRQILDY
jgi:Sigma-70 region 2